MATPTDPLDSTALASLHALAVNDPYLRLGATILMPPEVYFEWLNEKVNVLGADTSCVAVIDSYNEQYKLTIPGSGCLATAQEVRATLQSLLAEGPTIFERHVARCADFEKFVLRRGFLQNEDLITQIRCDGIIVMILDLTLAPI